MLHFTARQFSAPRSNIIHLWFNVKWEAGHYEMNERLKRDLIKSPAEPSVNIISALIKYGYVYFQHALGVKLTQIQCPVSLESLLVCHAPYRSVWSVHWPLLWANIVFPHMDVHFKIKTKRINQKKRKKKSKATPPTWSSVLWFL